MDFRAIVKDLIPKAIAFRTSLPLQCAVCGSSGPDFVVSFLKRASQNPDGTWQSWGDPVAVVRCPKCEGEYRLPPWMRKQNPLAT